MLLAIGWVLVAGLIGGVGEPAWAQGTALPQVEVWPRGAGTGQPGTYLPGGTVETVKKATPAGARLEQYLFVKLEDGALLVGVDPVNAPARTLQATFRPQLMAGRGLRADEREKAVAIVGQGYAETHKTAAGYKIAEMVYPGHTPGLQRGETRVEVVGIFAGAGDGDNLIIVPLAVAQTLAGTPEAVSLVTVTTRSTADAEAVKKGLESDL